MIVMKFGGTSTQDAAAIVNVVGIIKSRLSEPPIIVISAIAQATNLLEQAGRFAAERKTQDAHDLLTRLSSRHHLIIDTVIKNSQRCQQLKVIIDTSFGELKELIDGISILRELTPRTLDSIYCYGELLSSRIVAAALQENGVSSEWLDTKDFMITDDNFSRAMPLMDVVENRIKPIVLPLVGKGIVPVTQGFIGFTLSGRRTTMGRESSDYSASIIGSTLSVSDIQIWTDVDGVLTADPTIVTSPQKVKTLSFEEAYELSYFGAKVLHPNTMLPAIEKNIPIHIYNSHRPQSTGTLVTTHQLYKRTVVKSVAYKRDAVLVNVVPKRRYGQYIFWEHLQNILTRYSVTTSMTVTSEYSYSFILDSKNNIDSIKHDLEEIGDVEVIFNKGIVCIVGSNIRNAAGIIDKVFRTISDIPVDMISFGASKSNLSFVIDDNNIPETVRRIHVEFFEKSSDNEVFEILGHR